MNLMWTNPKVALDNYGALTVAEWAGGDYFSASTLPLEQANFGTQHISGAFWLWRSLHDRLGAPPILAELTAERLTAAGAYKFCHIFDVTSENPENYFTIFRNKISNNSKIIDMLLQPLGSWPFPLQSSSHALHLHHVRTSRRPVYSVIERVYDNRAQVYVRLLCPLSNANNEISHVLSVVKLQPTANPLKLSTH